MAPAKLQSGNLLQFPTVMGAVVVIVNLPDVKPNEIKLTGPMLADIFAGKITKWNDPKLAELNHGVKLPRMAIAPVHRADGSGTTFVFTSYLSAVSADWKSDVGASTSVNWPAGAGAKGNDGVAATVHNTRGGIGYVEYAYAKQNHLITTELRNKAGHFVQPTMTAFQAAAGSADWHNAPHYAVNLIDQPGDATWPIMSATFIELPKDPKDAAPQRQRDEVLRLGLQERRPDRDQPGLRAAARRGEGLGAQGLARRGQGTGRQAGDVTPQAPDDDSLCLCRPAAAPGAPWSAAGRSDVRPAPAARRVRWARRG